MDDNDFIQELRHEFNSTYGEGDYESYEDTSFINSQEEMDNLIKIVIRGFTVLLRELRKLVRSNGSYSLEVIIKSLDYKCNIRKVNGVLLLSDSVDNEFQSENLQEFIESMNAVGSGVPIYPITLISKVTSSGKQVLYRTDIWNFLKRNKREIIRKNRVNAQKVISRNLRDAIWNPNTQVGYNHGMRGWRELTGDISNVRSGIPVQDLYKQPVFKPPPPPPKMKGIFRNPQTLQIETAYEFGKKKVRLNLKQLKKDLMLLKKIKV